MQESAQQMQLRSKKTPRERERELMCFCSFGVKKKGGLDVFPPPGERTCKLDEASDSFLPLDFQLRKIPRYFTVCRCLSWFSWFPLEGHGFTRPRYQGWGSQKRMSTVLAAMEELPKRVRMPSTVQGEWGGVTKILLQNANNKPTPI